MEYLHGLRTSWQKFATLIPQDTRTYMLPDQKQIIRFLCTNVHVCRFIQYFLHMVFVVEFNLSE